jgi:iron complex outermembrane recepter protein
MVKIGLVASLALTAGVISQARAAEAPPGEQGHTGEIIVSATRVPTPITAIPNTVRVLDRNTLDTQLAVSPSLIDSLSFSIRALHRVGRR